MKIIGILGSPRGVGGNTGRLLKLVLEGAIENGAETEIVLLRGETVKPCKACDTCHKKGLCPQKDDFNEIKNRIIEADGLVLASPNYIFHVSAQLKAFIDRCCGVIHTIAFEGKYGASVVTSGGGEEEPIAEYMNHFMMTTGVMPVGSVWATMANLPDYKFTEEIQERAKELGKRLVNDFKNKTINPEYEEAAAKFRERIRKLIVWRKEEWPYEYEYWVKNHGMVE